MAHQVGFNKISQDDSGKLIESQGEELSNEYLMGMEQQRAAKDEDVAS